MDIKKLSLVLPFAIALSACEVPNATGGGSVNGWPSSDQSLSGTNLVEIEQNLRKLGLFRGRIDGQITEITRTAIARYQRSVGAPSNGVVSAKLVRSLRASVANVKPAPAVVKTTTKRKTTTTAPSAAPAPAAAPTPAAPPAFQGGEGDGGDSGGGDDGGGGGGGGSWG